MDTINSNTSSAASSFLTLEEPSQKVKDNIDDLLKRVANHLWPRLLCNLKKIEKEGEILLSTNPLSSLNYIISSSTDLKNLQKIKKRKDPRRWNKFLELFQMSMEYYHAIGKIHEKLPAFAEKSNLAYEVLFSLVEKRCWSDFLNYVTNESGK